VILLSKLSLTFTARLDNNYPLPTQGGLQVITLGLPFQFHRSSANVAFRRLQHSSAATILQHPANPKTRGSKGAQ
jgi:hypothetical protein